MRSTQPLDASEDSRGRDLMLNCDWRISIWNFKRRIRPNLFTKYRGQYETKDILSYQGLPFFLCFIFITQIDGANVTNVPLRVAFDKIKEADRRVRLHIKKADTSEVCLH